MKKLLAVLLTLTVVGVFAFADDAAKPTVTYTGKVETGFQINPNAKTIKLHDDDSGTASRIDLDVKATLGNFEVGYYIRDDLADANNAFSASNFWAGYTFFDGLAIVRAGKTDAGTTGTVNKGWGDGINSDGGVQVIIAPIAGLQIGGAFGHLTAASQDLKDTFGKPAVGLAYTLAGLGDLRVNYTSFDRLLTAGFNYTGVPGLTAQLEGYGIGNKISPMEFFEKIGYTVGSATPYVQAYEGTAKDLDLAFLVNPGVDYAVNSVVTVGGSFTYTSNKAKNAYAWKDIGSPAKDTVLKDSGYSASPYLQFNFNSLASCLKIWYDTGDLANKGDGKIEVNFRSFF